MKATIFIGSLKKNPEESNTAAVSKLAAKELKEYGVETRFRYLRKYHITPGVEFDTGDPKDQMRILYEDINQSDIIVLATPTWWGIHSSLCQAWMERVGAYDDLAIETNMTPLYNKVFGSISTASNDGHQHIAGLFNAFASNLGMTIPPESNISWSTIVKHSKGDNPEDNDETMNTIKNACRNWFLWATMIKKLELGTVAQKIKPGKVGVLSTDKFSS